MNRFQELKILVLALEEEFTKFYDKGNKAAGTRIRKAMQELKKLAQEVRTNILEYKTEGHNSEET